MNLTDITSKGELLVSFLLFRCNKLLFLTSSAVTKRLISPQERNVVIGLFLTLFRIILWFSLFLIIIKKMERRGRSIDKLYFVL